MGRSLVYTRQRRRLIRDLDHFAAGVSEERVSRYPVWLTTPAYGLNRAVTFLLRHAVFAPAPRPVTPEGFGISNKLNATVTVRKHFMPEHDFITERNGHLHNGYRIRARGRFYIPIEMVQDQAEIMFVLSDKEVLEDRE